MRFLLCHSVVILILKYYGQGYQMLLLCQYNICLSVYYPVHELSYMCVPGLQVELNVVL